MRAISLVALTVFGALMLASPAATQPACGNGGGQIGPCPALIDSSGNGLPDPGIDGQINFTLVGDTLTIINPWSSGPCAGNVIPLTSVGGYYEGATRPRPGSNFQQMFIQSFDDNHDPVSFGFYDSSTSTSGFGVLRDANGDFRYESIQLSGPVNLTLGFVGADLDGDTQPDYVSVPWAQASMFGMNGTCGMPGGDPQIWIPLDGDRIVPGFPGFHSSPRIAAAAALLGAGAAIPTLDGWGLPLLVTLLAAAGCWFARQHRLLA